jgi:hypothetical protein
MPLRISRRSTRGFRSIQGSNERSLVLFINSFPLQVRPTQCNRGRRSQERVSGG